MRTIKYINRLRFGWFSRHFEYTYAELTASQSMQWYAPNYVLIFCSLPNTSAGEVFLK